jgi:hypothetical protein
MNSFTRRRCLNGAMNSFTRRRCLNGAMNSFTRRLFVGTRKLPVFLTAAL